LGKSREAAPKSSGYSHSTKVEYSFALPVHLSNCASICTVLRVVALDVCSADKPRNLHKERLPHFETKTCASERVSEAQKQYHVLHTSSERHVVMLGWRADDRYEY
jgi:hypothetical protein